MGLLRVCCSPFYWSVSSISVDTERTRTDLWPCRLGSQHFVVTGLLATGPVTGHTIITSMATSQWPCLWWESHLNLANNLSPGPALEQRGDGTEWGDQQADRQVVQR